MNGADTFEREQSFTAKEGAQIEIIHKDKQVFLKIVIPKGAFSGLQTKVIGTADLGMTRLSEEGYENPDGSPLTICLDFLSEKIIDNPIPGPLQCLKEGENLIKIWG